MTTENTTDSSVGTQLQETGLETIKFGLVGISGIGVNFITLWIALNLLGANDAVALALGIVVSMTTNYLLNRVWTFHSEHEKRTEYPKYILSNLAGIALQYFIGLGVENYFESIDFFSINLLVIDLPSIYLASMIGILVGFVANFSFSKFFVFN